MGSDLRKSFATYPMVEEAEAMGRVAAVYSQILRSMPFVPSIFKSLAVCPAYLVLAWDQASHGLAEEEITEAAAGLSRAAADLADPPDDGEAREVLGEFVGPLGRMLLLSAGLLHAGQGDLDGAPASPEPPPAGPVEPQRHVASQWEVEAWATYGDIRALLETPMINSIWRVLAQKGLLDRAWSQLRPQVSASRPGADRLQQLALDRARSLPWPVVAGPSAFEAAGIADAVPAVSSILDAYVKTLPRVLALAGSSAPSS